MCHDRLHPIRSFHFKRALLQTVREQPHAKLSVQHAHQCVSLERAGNDTLEPTLKRRRIVMWVVTTLNCPTSVDGTFNVDHSRCLVGIEMTWVQHPGSSPELS